MDEIAALYSQLDPLRPLDADDDALYVDWQRELGGGSDVKSQLVRTFVRNATPERPITRLLTGHKGSGKTTELNRVRRALERAEVGKRVFTSTLFAQRWLDLEDVQPEDLVLQIVRQLVSDLRGAGVDFAEQEFTGFFARVRERFRDVRAEKVEIGADPLRFSFALNDFPSARKEFREVLRGQLPNVFDLVNRDLLPAARHQLRERGYEDLLIIIDDLDKIPQKPLGDGRLTNHENLFLDNASTLRALSCSVLMTIPIELAYSPAQQRLRDDYGASIATVPIVSVRSRDGEDIPDGIGALVEILGRRARRASGDDDVEASAAAGRLFADEQVLRDVVLLSGGHVRGLLVMLTEMLDLVDELPLGRDVVEQHTSRTARNLARALFPRQKEILHQVIDDGEPVDDPVFFTLLQNQYVFAYEAGDDDYWYGVNPLLREIDL